MVHYQLPIGGQPDVKLGAIAMDGVGFGESCQGLVGTEAVIEVELAQFAHGFFMKGPGSGCFVEVEVTAEYFIGPSPINTILMPMLLMTRASRYMGVEARTVVMS